MAFAISSRFEMTIRRLLFALTYRRFVHMMTAQPTRQYIGKGSAMESAFSRKEITAMLRAWSDGSEAASDEFIRAVYHELQLRARYQLRRERPNHTLQTSAL